jgi:(1->4)-alpha-D-glucan 1-alpha-D-glucosylmutase
LPNERYESVCRDFVFHLLDADSNLDFLGEVIAWVCRITPAATANGLTQTLLRLTSPGVPDLYQGTEFWDFSLVDPDNRRAVDYAERGAALGKVALDIRWRERPAAQLKQPLIHLLLTLRREHPKLFECGDYIPLEVAGPHADKLIAFARRYRDAEADSDTAIIIAATVLRGREIAEASFRGLDWWGTDVLLPEGFAGDWNDLFDGQVKTSEQGAAPALPARILLGDMPIAAIKRSMKPESGQSGSLRSTGQVPALQKP